MAQHPNERVILRLFEAHGRGDAATVRAVLANDVAYHLPGRSPMAGAYLGADAVLALWARQTAYLGGHPYRVETAGMVADDERVVLLANGTAERDGEILVWRGVNVYAFLQGKIAECRVFISDLYAFDAFWAGMPPVTMTDGRDG